MKKSPAGTAVGSVEKDVRVRDTAPSWCIMHNPSSSPIGFARRCSCAIIWHIQQLDNDKGLTCWHAAEHTVWRTLVTSYSFCRGCLTQSNIFKQKLQNCEPIGLSRFAVNLSFIFSSKNWLLIAYEQSSSRSSWLKAFFVSLVMVTMVTMSFQHYNSSALWALGFRTVEYASQIIDILLNNAGTVHHLLTPYMTRVNFILFWIVPFMCGASAVRLLS
jgi:hypothetical protein